MESSDGILRIGQVEIQDKLFTSRGNTIQLGGVNDPNHGLQYAQNFANTFIDGPVVYGWRGGALGIKKDSGQMEEVVLSWKDNGNVAIKGKLEAKEVKVTNTPTADFVFEENYDLPKLQDVEQHIKEKKHLPEIASAKEMEKNGVNIGEFQIKLLQKIEELTLYSIEQNKQIKQLQNENKLLKSQCKAIQELQQQVQHLLSTQK